MLQGWPESPVEHSKDDFFHNLSILSALVGSFVSFWLIEFLKQNTSDLHNGFTCGFLMTKRHLKKIWHQLDSRTYAGIISSPALLWSWVKVWQTVPVLSWVKAAQSFRNKDFRTALFYYEKGLRRRKDHPAAMCAKFDLAFCYYRLGKLEEAVAILAELVSGKNCPRDPYLLLASIHRSLGNLEVAAGILRRCKGQFARDMQVSVRLADVLLEIGESTKELQQLFVFLKRRRSELLLSDPKQSLLDTVIANYEIHHGQAVAGLQLLGRVIASGTAPYEAYILRAELYLQEGRVLSARELLRKAMLLSPRNPRPLVLLSQSYCHVSGFAEPTWALDLAVEAVKLSAYRNVDALAAAVTASLICNETDMADLYQERLNSLRVTQQINLDTIRHALEHVERLRSL